jgi:hypothetical protein
MDWSDANEPENNVDEVGEWENRITADHASQGTIRGVSLEYMIAMANQVGADAWFSVPIVATDDFVDSMATMVRDRLDPGLTAYIELSNEVWNPSFPQHAVAAERGRALGFSDPTAANEGYRFIFADPEQFLSAVRFHAHRSVQVFEIFERVFGGRERFVRVIGGWAPDGNELAVQVAEEILDFQDAYTQADAYAIAPYFGITLALEERQEFVETSSVDAILDTATAELRFMLDVGRAVLDVTEARGLELVTYESGQHMVQATETPYLSDLVEAKLTLAQNDERLYDMYTEYLNAWAQFGGLMNLFNDSLPLGSFGLVSRWDQDLATAPRYRAVQDFLVTEDPNQPAPRTGDADGDGDIDLDDFFVFVEAFLTSDARFDFDGNDIVNLDDFFEFSEVFGT